MTRLLFFTLLYLLAAQTIANNSIDSLENLINKSTDNQKVDILNELATTYFSISPIKAEEYAQEAKKIAIKLNDKKKIAESIKNIGKSYYFRGNFEKTLDYFREALKYFEEINDLQGISSSNNNIGIIYKNWGEYETALQYFQRALEIDESIGNKSGIAASLQNMGVLYLNWNNYEKALDYYKRSLRIKEELNDEHGIANSLNNIGEIYFKWNNYEKALENYNKSLGIRQKIKDNNGISTSFHNIGEVYKFMNNYDLALEYYLKAFDLQESVGDKLGMSSSLNNIGEINQKKKHFTKALEYYEFAVNVQQEIGNRKGLANSYHRIGTVYDETGDYEKAIEYFSMSLTLSEELEAIDMQMNLFSSFANVYKSKGDFEKALINYQKYITLKDSIFNYVKFAEITTKYETEKLERENQIEIDKKQNQIERQRIIMNAIVFGAILILIFLSMLFRLFIQKKKANHLLQKQKQEITDSILYASRIQQAVLPPNDSIEEILKDFFILNIPRDIVSGDFYWISRKENKVIVAVADCTGHGVPGAFMSMLGITFLNEIASQLTILNPAEILDELRNKVINSLHQKGVEGEARDGMDISLCVIDFENSKMEFAGANNPLYIVKNEKLKVKSLSSNKFDIISNDSPVIPNEYEESNFQLYELKGDKMPIGLYEKMDKYTNHLINLQKSDTIYLFSDGYADQFGGSRKKKFKYNQFKKLFIDNCHLPMSEQKIILNNTIKSWRGDLDQIDDILILGIRF
ncbi:MAG: hypothetical protein A2W98_13570 [Bacteroidetes bacterium GWF2_33_38]|nr:MAG: hypothetical protein A2W98_13570 [Bacteroidetes bacterium GWF2_33_38]OFY90148.1 MAG: hypothetical protein A2236_11870 [Bacteroidetes bacterium RIFOXYA2_FULL_33_7]